MTKVGLWTDRVSTPFFAFCH